MPPIFRKTALERLSSPEQLDQLMQVTTPKGWLALASLFGLVFAALLWGVFGSVPTQALGEGILIRQGGVSDLVVTGSGQVDEVLVSVGDVVAKDQVVAKVSQDGLIRQIRDTEARRGALLAEVAALEGYTEEQKRLTAGNLAQKRANLERSIETVEKELELLRERMTVQRDLLRDGLITQQTLLATEQELNASRDKVAVLRLDLNGLELQRLEGEQQVEQQLEVKRSALRDLELDLAEHKASLAENVNVISPYAGRVLELTADRGDVVSPGTSILTMEVVSEELVAVIFVPSSQGKQVQPGMSVRIVPSTVKREEHGYILGTVTRVAEFPSTSRGMRRLLANEELVNKLMQADPPIQVDVALSKDAATPTGYSWSSSKGPDLEISSGTLASGSVIVRQDRPITLVLPKIREQLGV